MMTIRHLVRAYTSHAVFIVTIFLSAFLLFAVEPMAGKRLLPFFGGSSSVWAVSLLFFTATLFAGYAYVFALTRFAGKWHVYVHTAVTALIALAVILHVHEWHGLYPPFDSAKDAAFEPSLKLLRALVGALGAPFFLLATTGPLLQYWYGVMFRREPYALYALSNAGSFVALLAYPFLIEPAFPLGSSETAWSIFFYVYVVLVTLACAMAIRARVRTPTREMVERTPIARVIEWILYAALPAYMLVAVTTSITQLVAPVPLLWVVPLAVYLLTFVLAFSGFGQRSLLVQVLALCAVVFAYYHTSLSFRNDAWWTVTSYVALLFFCGLICHARLYRVRPALARLPLFYLLVSFGGVLGTLAVSIGAPMLFPDLWEFPFGLAAFAAALVTLMPVDMFPRALSDERIHLVKIVCSIAAFVLAIDIVLAGQTGASIESRDFYGSARINFDPGLTVLMNGTTVHGFQATDRKLQPLPTSYYVPSSGVGRAMRYEQNAHTTDMRVAVIGLGVGTLAAYCRPNDMFVFYEIDEHVEHLARSYFSYLSRCAGAHVRIGDGRVALTQELYAGEGSSYDLVVMDAFADDTVPVHLLTKEAIALYVAHTRSPRSVIAVHISNRYLDLAPVMLKIASALNLNAMIVNDDGASSDLGSASEWVLFTKDPKVFSAKVFSDAGSALPDIRSAPLWSDDHASLWGVWTYRGFW